VPNIPGRQSKAYAVTGEDAGGAAPRHPDGRWRLVFPGLYMQCGMAYGHRGRAPKNIVGPIEPAVIEALADPAVRKRLGDLGQDIPRANSNRQKRLAAYQRRRSTKWWPLIKAAESRGIGRARGAGLRPFARGGGRILKSVRTGRLQIESFRTQPLPVQPNHPGPVGLATNSSIYVQLHCTTGPTTKLGDAIHWFDCERRPPIGSTAKPSPWPW